MIEIKINMPTNPLSDTIVDFNGTEFKFSVSSSARIWASETAEALQKVGTPVLVTLKYLVKSDERGEL